MVDQLRLFLNRPLRDSDRLRLFVIAVAVIAAAAAIFWLLDSGSPAPRRSAASRAASVPPVAVPAASPEPVATSTAPPSEEGTPSAALEASRSDVAQANHAARRFLAGYLPYSYGHVGRIRAVSDELRHRLARQQPRVPARARHRRPRMVLVQADGVSRNRASLVALVDDGARRYSVALGLARTRAGWKVTDVGA